MLTVLLLQDKALIPLVSFRRLPATQAFPVRASGKVIFFLSSCFSYIVLSKDKHAFLRRSVAFAKAVFVTSIMSYLEIKVS